MARNGLGLTPSQAEAELARFHADFPVLDDPPAVLQVWEQLVARQQVIGKNAHDAHLVAAMLVHCIDQLLKADFGRYQSIAVSSPQDVIGPPSAP